MSTISLKETATDRQIAAFCNKIDLESKPGCWIWKGAVSSDGYGASSFYPRKFVRAHRASYELHFGKIGDGLFVCHHCDTPLCVNPHHLYAGTVKENMRDAVNRGRMASGDRSPSRMHPERMARGDRNGSRKHPERLCRGESVNTARLTASDVSKIRELYQSGEFTQVNLASMFRVKQANISQIIRRKNWRHVP